MKPIGFILTWKEVDINAKLTKLKETNFIILSAKLCH